jgi:hypothetical protein
MLLRSDRARLEYILQGISDIETIVRRHGSAEQTVEGRPALLMEKN